MDRESDVLHEIANKLKERAAGNLEAVRDIWADDMVVWHSFDDREQHIPGWLRHAHSLAKLNAMKDRIPEFRRIVTHYVSESTNAVIEVTTWVGEAGDDPDVGLRIERIQHQSVTIYHVANGRVHRLDILDDPAASRATTQQTRIWERGSRL
jgi:hypothetical protein